MGTQPSAGARVTCVNTDVWTPPQFLIQKVQGEDSTTCVSQKFQMLLLQLVQGPEFKNC